MPRRALPLAGLLLLLVIAGVALFGSDVWQSRTSRPAGDVPLQVEPMRKVSALGRVEPRNGIIRVAGPPHAAVVIEALMAEEGDWVERGQVLAVLLGIAVQRAEVARLRAELAKTRDDLTRNQALFRRGSLSESDLRSLELARDVSAAAVQRAEAELGLSTVTAPMSGQILEIHAHAGERVDQQGILELGDTSVMYAVAEVYETDIGRVRVGQKAEIRSPALPHPLTGEVERIGLKIGKRDVLSTDPVADADARVVEVEVRLLEPALVAALSNLHVDVVFESPGDERD